MMSLSQKSISDHSPASRPPDSACNTRIWNSHVPCRDSGSILLAVVLYLNILSLVLTGLTAHLHNSLDNHSLLSEGPPIRFLFNHSAPERQPLHWCPPLGREPFLTLLRISYMLSSGGHYLHLLFLRCPGPTCQHIRVNAPTRCSAGTLTLHTTGNMSAHQGGNINPPGTPHRLAGVWVLAHWCVVISVRWHLGAWACCTLVSGHGPYIGTLIGGCVQVGMWLCGHVGMWVCVSGHCCLIGVWVCRHIGAGASGGWYINSALGPCGIGVWWGILMNFWLVMALWKVLANLHWQQLRSCPVQVWDRDRTYSLVLVRPLAFSLI